MAKEIINLRIHGDNILECENALKLIVKAINAGEIKLINGPAYSPVYQIDYSGKHIFKVKLFPGYKRWNFDLIEYISSLGGQLREAVDAVITKVEDSKELPIVAFEFSGALPAGNNAWQRNGRALAFAHAGIPYLYFTEIGGQELNSERIAKAARFPNPLVPFSYISLSQEKNIISLPVYIPSPSIEKSILKLFKDCFGEEEAINLLRNILLEEDYKKVRENLTYKVGQFLNILTGQRKKKDILEKAEWKKLFNQQSGGKKADWLVKKNLDWHKKIGIKPISPTLIKLKNKTEKIGVSAGSKDMPICIIPKEKRGIYAKEIKKIYKTRINEEFLKWLEKKDKNLICVWIAGFKPRGDDSRPDRGLVPLSRMIFGFSNIDLLAIVYGPAKESNWNMLRKDMKKLAKTNGLWESIINLSDAILIDSMTSRSLKEISFLTHQNFKAISSKKLLLKQAEKIPVFGEQDVDSILHLIFSNRESVGIYESLCNPPGGDWSGVSLLDFKTKIKYRWTSLPRVSGAETKRPDHIIQFNFNNSIISIESKDNLSKLEKNIGLRLKKYIINLYKIKPIACKAKSELYWKIFNKSNYPNNFFVFSAVAFQIKKKSDLSEALIKSKADIVLGLEFNTSSEPTTIHILTNNNGKKYIPLFKKIISDFNFLKLEIHS